MNTEADLRFLSFCEGASKGAVRQKHLINDTRHAVLVAEPIPAKEKGQHFMNCPLKFPQEEWIE